MTTDFAYYDRQQLIRSMMTPWERVIAFLTSTEGP